MKRIAATALLVLAAAPGSTSDHPPVDAGITEEVEVRLVIVDVMVVDRKGRTVPGLRIEDFELLLDYDPVRIDTFDAACAARLDDPRPLAHGENRGASSGERKIVLAFDYAHLGQIARHDVLERAKTMVLSGATEGDEVMAVVLTGERPRVELGFTRDRGELLEVLDRMQNDRTLWARAYDHLHELRFFRDLNSVVDLLGLVPGSKAIVLFSDMGGRSDDYDLPFESLSASAALARVSIFPVLAAGLTRKSSPRLRRIAVETGGRFTENTNDLSLALARAQRDLECRYALGFYDRTGERDRAHRVSVHVRRKGLRAVHPDNYELPSEEDRTDAALLSGLIAPAMFASSRIQVRLVPAEPDGRRWRSVAAVRFPADVETWEGRGTMRDLGILVRRNQTVVALARHRLRLASPAGDLAPGGDVTFLAPLRLRPGRYTVSATVLDPGTGRPLAASGETQLPAARDDGTPFLVGPLLGRRPGGIRIVGDERTDEPASEPDSGLGDFEPLSGAGVAAPEPLLARTLVCLSRPSEEGVEAVLVRRLLAEDGAEELTPSPARVSWAPRERGCREIVDSLPAEALTPGVHVFEARVAPGEAGTSLAELRVGE